MPSLGLGGLGGGQPASSPPPPEVPPRAAPKVESDAFLDLDPLGDKSIRDVAVKDMFKDFQMAKPPAVPARKGKGQLLSSILLLQNGPVSGALTTP